MRIFFEKKMKMVEHERATEAEMLKRKMALNIDAVVVMHAPLFYEEVREKERKRERERERTCVVYFLNIHALVVKHPSLLPRIVCLCVREGERERERESLRVSD